MTRTAALAALHDYLSGPEDEFLTALQKRTAFSNPWLTLENQQRSLRAIVDEFLAPGKLAAFTARYSIPPTRSAPRTVGLVLAGNIPLVGFHDVLCVYLSGHRARIKPSSKDEFVLPYLLQLLARFDPAAAEQLTIVPTLKGYDAVIATGSNNSARYFESYFGAVPHLIRRNRNAVAILDGSETTAELRALGQDVFTYFGLGCRNVSHLRVPEGYDFAPLLEVFHDWRHYQHHPKWKNNYDYNYALLLLNKEPFLSNGAVLLRESDQLASHIAGLFYGHDADPAASVAALAARRDGIQLVVGHHPVPGLPHFPFGQAQQPGLADFADGVDTMAFLLNLTTQ